MKFKIPTRDELSGTQRRYKAAKWLIFALMLILCYVIMRSGIFVKWEPVLLIPLCVAVAMYEDELSSCIFALFCGYMTDISFGFIFGFSAVWLMGICVCASLLVRNLIRANFINYLIIVTAATLLEFSMDYLFYVAIWNTPKSEVILKVSVIPTVIATLISSPAVYWLVKTVELRLGADSVNVVYYDDTAEQEQEDEE